MTKDERAELRRLLTEAAPLEEARGVREEQSITSTAASAPRLGNIRDNGSVTFHDYHCYGGTQHIINGQANINIGPRPKVQVVIQPGPDHIDDAQKVRLRELVNEIVELERTVKRVPRGAGEIWGALAVRFRVASYHRILDRDFALAEAWLQTWCARLRSPKHASVRESDWRHSRYSYINTVAKQIGRTEDLARLLTESYQDRPLKELSQLELETVRRIVAEWKKQARLKGN